MFISHLIQTTSYFALGLAEPALLKFGPERKARA
jgi:hypothetical protein